MEGKQRCDKITLKHSSAAKSKVMKEVCKYFYLHVGLCPLCKCKEAVSVKCAGRREMRKGKRKELLPGLAPFFKLSTWSYTGGSSCNSIVRVSLHSVGYYKKKKACILKINA